MVFKKGERNTTTRIKYQWILSYTITIILSSISNPIPTLIWDLQQEIQMTIIISAHSPSLKLYFWKQVLVPELNRQYNKKFSTYSLSYIIYYASYRVQTKYEEVVSQGTRMEFNGWRKWV